MDQKPLRIILVEDNPADVVLTRMSVEESGTVHDLMVIADGEAALAYLRVADPLPDLILLDLKLPKRDGFAVLEQLRVMPRFSRVPVAILSCSQTPEDRERSLMLGASAYFEKPNSLAGYKKLAHRFETLCHTFSAP
jgi:CheY-like chemotaxis protein